MVMFLMALCLSMFGLAVTAIAFGAATRDERPMEAAQPAVKPALPVSLSPSRFFTDLPVVPIVPAVAAAARPQVPIEVLLLQIDRHVRLEQAAAESFLDYPDRLLAAQPDGVAAGSLDAGDAMSTVEPELLKTLTPAEADEVLALGSRRAARDRCRAVHAWRAGGPPLRRRTGPASR